MKAIFEYTIWLPCTVGLLGLLFTAFDRSMSAPKRRLLMSLEFAFAVWAVHVAMPIHSTIEAISYAATGVFGFIETREAVRRLQQSEGERG
jgi:hypothetical protein